MEKKKKVHIYIDIVITVKVKKVQFHENARIVYEQEKANGKIKKNVATKK